MSLAHALYVLVQAVQHASPAAPTSTPRDWESRIGLFFAAVGAGLAGIFGTWKLVTKLIKDARTAKAAEETRVQQRIDDAVGMAKEEARHQIDMTKQLCKHWEDMAGVFEKEKNHERQIFETTLSRLKEEEERLREERGLAVRELAAAKSKIEEVVDLNLGLQGQITDMGKRVTASEKTARELAVKVSSLHKGS